MTARLIENVPNFILFPLIYGSIISKITLFSTGMSISRRAARLVGMKGGTKPICLNKDNTMQYMCIIYTTEGTGPQPGPDDWGPFMQGYQDFTAKVTQDGKLVHADAL